MEKAERRPLEWVASSLRDLKSFPYDVQDIMGYALDKAQQGGKHVDAKPLKGLGTRVFEVVANHRGDTYRAVYTVRFAKAVYVLHAFQKKAKKGTKTPKVDIELVKRRLKAAEEHYRSTHGKGE